MAHDNVVARSGDFSVIERLGDVHPTFAVVGSLDDDLKAVCKAAAEVERLRKARIVFDRYGIDYLGVRRSIDRKVVVKEIFIQPRLVRKLQIAARADGSIVPEQAIPVALRGRDASPQRQGRRIALHLDEQFAHHVVSAVAADRISRVGVIDIEGIAADTGVDLAVAQNRDREPVMHVRPDIEIRGVVSSKVNIISQYFRPAHSADQQIRSIRGNIVRVLLTLVGDRRYRTLPVRQQITVACGLLSRKFNFRTARIVVRVVRRSGRHVENRYRARYGKQLYGAKLDIRGLDGDIVGNLRHTAPDLDGRQRQHPVCRGNYRYIALIGHRQYIVLVGMRHGEIFRCGVFTQIAAHVGGNAHPIVARQALETQRRRGLITVQDNIAVIVVKVEVQVPDGVFIRSAGYGHHRFRTNRHFDPNFRWVAAIRLILVNTAVQNAQRKQ